MTHLRTTFTLLALALAVPGCKSSDSTAPAGTAGKAVDKPAEPAATTPTPAPAPTPAAPTPVAKPAPTGPSADATKDFLGLTLPPMGNWKPTWDADAKVAKWENDGYMTGIVIRIVSDKLDTIDDLKSAAPMMMQLGTAIVKVEDTKATDKGWYAIVDDDEGKDVEMVYVRHFGDSQIVCSGNLTPRKDATSAGGITKDEVTKACESVTVKQ